VTFLVRAELADTAPTDAYPYELPAVKALPDLSFDQEVTILVGDNGTGKSTLVEGIAVAAGLNPEGGSRNLQFSTYSTHSSLGDHLRLQRKNPFGWGWFLRAETFYGMASHIHADDGPYGIARMFPDLHGRSHGESFLTLIESRMDDAGFFILDEPESALSFHGQLKLLRIMHIACSYGAQFILATHSPMLMAYPGARIYELDEQGSSLVDWEDVEAVDLWRSFLTEPDRFFAHLFADGEQDAE